MFFLRIKSIRAASLLRWDFCFQCSLLLLLVLAFSTITLVFIITPLNDSGLSPLEQPPIYGIVQDVRLVTLFVGEESSDLCAALTMQCLLNSHWVQPRYAGKLSNWQSISDIPERALIEDYERVLAYANSLKNLKESSSPSALQRTLVMVLPADRALLGPLTTEQSITDAFSKIQNRFQFSRVIFSAQKENVPSSTSERVESNSARMWREQGVMDPTSQSDHSDHSGRNRRRQLKRPVSRYLHSGAFIGYFYDVARLVNIEMEIISHPDKYPSMWRNFGMVPSFRWQSEQGLLQRLFSTFCLKIGLPSEMYPKHLKSVCSKPYAKGAIEELIYPDFYSELFHFVNDDGEWDQIYPSIMNHTRINSEMQKQQRNQSMTTEEEDERVEQKEQMNGDEGFVVIFKDSVIHQRSTKKLIETETMSNLIQTRQTNDNQSSEEQCGIWSSDPPRWLSSLQCSSEWSDHTAKEKEKEREEDDSVTILPFPWQASKWTRIGNFYHTMQCIWTGITEIRSSSSSDTSNSRDFKEVVKDWRNLRVAWASRERTEENERNPIASEIARVFDGRFDQNQQLIVIDDESNENKNGKRRVWKNYYLSSKQDANGQVLNGRCRPNGSDEVRLWLQLFFESKFGCKLLRYNAEQRFKHTKEYCHQSFELNQLSLLIIGRSVADRNYDGTQLAQELRGLNYLKKVTYVQELSDLSLAKQSILFATHHFIVQPHGASGTGLMLSNSISMNEGPPTINFELGPAYGHCAYPLNLTPHFFRSRLLKTTFGIVYEYPHLDCAELERRILQSNRSELTVRRAFKEKYANFAPLTADILIDLMKEKVKSVIIPHCLGHSNVSLLPAIAWTGLMKDPRHIADLRMSLKQAKLGNLPDKPSLSEYLISWFRPKD